METKPTTDDAIQERIDQEYKWGFVTDIEAESAPPGLDEEMRLRGILDAARRLAAAVPAGPRVLRQDLRGHGGP